MLIYIKMSIHFLPLESGLLSKQISITVCSVGFEPQYMVHLHVPDHFWFRTLVYSREVVKLVCEQCSHTNLTTSPLYTGVRL